VASHLTVSRRDPVTWRSLSVVDKGGGDVCCLGLESETRSFFFLDNQPSDDSIPPSSDFIIDITHRDPHRTRRIQSTRVRFRVFSGDFGRRNLVS
jgi:hypothetical protein